MAKHAHPASLWDMGKPFKHHQELWAEKRMWTSHTDTTRKTPSAFISAALLWYQPHSLKQELVDCADCRTCNHTCPCAWLQIPFIKNVVGILSLLLTIISIHQSGSKTLQMIPKPTPNHCSKKSIFGGLHALPRGNQLQQPTCNSQVFRAFTVIGSDLLSMWIIIKYFSFEQYLEW